MDSVAVVGELVVGGAGIGDGSSGRGSEQGADYRMIGVILQLRSFNRSLLSTLSR